MARKRYSDEDILKLLGEIELNLATAHVIDRRSGHEFISANRI
jgi:hypothetical protein